MPEKNDELANLKSLVSDALLKRGILGKLKAQLRASVFSVLQESDKGKELTLGSTKAQKLRESHEGKLALELVRDLLKCLDLEYTLAVFLPEADLSDDPLLDGDTTAQELGIHARKSEEPLLLGLLQGGRVQSTRHDKALQEETTSPAPKGALTPLSVTPLKSGSAAGDALSLSPLDDLPPPTLPQTTQIQPLMPPSASPTKPLHRASPPPIPPRKDSSQAEPSPAGPATRSKEITAAEPPDEDISEDILEEEDDEESKDVELEGLEGPLRTESELMTSDRSVSPPISTGEYDLSESVE
ncbi:FGFR1 oncoprotein partner [Rhizophlyctis rosea]|nr:FGFR1 oncoprotein partner [Rhizophlyctis rosea]